MKTEKKKLNLDDLKVQSFVTSLNNEDALQLKGGTDAGLEVILKAGDEATAVAKNTYKQGDYNVCTLA